MTNAELQKRVADITSATPDVKEEIIKRFKHYKTCSDEELLQSCIFIEGIMKGLKVRDGAIEQKSNNSPRRRRLMKLAGLMKLIAWVIIFILVAIGMGLFPLAIIWQSANDTADAVKKQLMDEL